MTGLTRLKGRVLRWMATGTIAVAGLAVGPGPAQASSIAPTNFGCSQYHHILDVHQLPIYSGSFCAYIGQNPGAPFRDEPLSSAYAQRYEGSFNAFSYRIHGTPTACNFWVDLDLYDSGQRYYHSQGTEVHGCTSALGSTYNRKFNADIILRPSSQVCATVFRWSGTVVVRHAGICAVIS
jgi:hypothetical protein